MSFSAHSVDGVAILLWAAEPEAPHRLATPFFYAAAAAAMDVPVEIYFAARSVHLLVPGMAQRLRAGQHEKTIWDAMQEATSHGAKLFACTDALIAQGLERSALIAECGGHGGAVQFMARACDQRWRAMVF
jgi:predicted peroxiredoxin